MTIKELRSQQEKLLHDAREELSKLENDKISDGDAAEVEARHDKIMAEWDKIEARASRLEALEAREEQLQRPDPRRPMVGEGRSASGREQRTVTTESAFRSYLLKGEHNLTQAEQAALAEHRNVQSVGTNSQGGFTVPVGFRAELIKSLADYSPMFEPGVTRQLDTASGELINMPTLDDTSSKATIIGEGVEVVSTGGSANAPGSLVFGQKTLRAYKYSTGLIKVSMELAQDSAINLEAEIRTAMAERLGRGAGEHLTTGLGNGSSQPWGIVTRSAEGYENALTVAGASGVPVLRFDDLIDLEHSVDPAYRRSPAAGWMFNDNTLKALRKIKDKEDRYIWQPADAATGARPTVLGYRYAINPAMANLAFDAKPIVFGDMNRYVVRRVMDLSVVRLNERFAEFGQLAFIGFARLDGELLDTAAVKHLVVPSDPS